MASEDLREFLLQEISDVRSRYREAAVDTLRIFPCDKTAKALHGLVGDPASPGSLRARAIAVLADLEVEEAADALVEIALLDRDAEVRDEASGRLAAAASEPLLRRALQRLREVPLAPDAAPPGWRTAVWNLARLAASVGLVIANFFVHGLILMFLGRYRLGAALLVVEGLSLWIFRDQITLALPALFLTGLLGQLVPMGILLLHRRERRLKLGSLRGTLVITLFIANAFSSLLLFHGLAHAAMRRSRRAVVLLALEMAALFLAYFLYRLPGVVFSVSFNNVPEKVLSDALLTSYDSIFFTRRHEHELRRHGLYDRLIANPIAARAVLDQLTGVAPGDIAWARTVLRKSGGSMPPELLLDRLGETPARRLMYSTLVRKEGTVVPLLRASWQTADREKRRRIVSLLSRRPTEGSLTALKELWSQLSRRERARAFLSFWHFRFRAWPKTFILVMLFTFPLLALLCYQGFRAVAYPAELQLKMLRDEQEDSSKRIVSAMFLAAVFPSREVINQLDAVLSTTKEEEVKIGVAEHSAQQEKALGALAKHLGPQESPQVRSKILEGLETVAETAPYPVASGATGLALSRMLRDPQEKPTFRHKALDVLEASRAVAVIADLAASAPAPGSPLPDGDTQQLDAISALGRIATLEAHQALLRLRKNPRLAKELRVSAQSEAAGMRQRLREELADERYEAVLSKAKTFLEARPEVIPRRELHLLLGTASANLAKHVADAEPLRAQDLREAAITHLEKAGRLPPEEARLLAEAYQAKKDWLHGQSITAPAASWHR
jgi:hypothetical protein